MKDQPGQRQFSSVAELYAVAYEIEADAMERYNELADAMQTHNNLELARIFRDLARAEGLHADEIRRLAGDLGVDVDQRAIGRWRTESPESADLEAVHYRMSPHDALLLVQAAEERALAFYTELAAAATDPAVRKLAESFREEEVQHVELCRRLLLRYPAAPLPLPPEDPDPPGSGD